MHSQYVLLRVLGVSRLREPSWLAATMRGFKARMYAAGKADLLLSELVTLAFRFLAHSS